MLTEPCHFFSTVWSRAVLQGLHMARDAMFPITDLIPSIHPEGLVLSRDLLAWSYRTALSLFSPKFVLGSLESSSTDQCTKGTEVAEQQEFKKSFILEEFDRSRCGNIQVDIVAYRGQLANPRWMDTEEGGF